MKKNALESVSISVLAEFDARSMSFTVFCYVSVSGRVTLML